MKKKKKSTKPNKLKLRKGDEVSYAIKLQGAPIVNEGYVREVGKNIVALEIDLKSKYCEVGGSFLVIDGACGVFINANKRSLYINEDVRRDEQTAIEFIDFVGWDVFACGIGRYTLRVCLMRKAGLVHKGIKF